MKTYNAGAFLTLLTFALATPAQPPQPFPVKIDMSLQWNIRLLTPQQQCGGPSAPWYVYFPYDCHSQSTASANQYPNWPQPFPASATQEGKTGSSQTSVSYYRRPLSYNPPQAPSYWYQK